MKPEAPASTTPLRRVTLRTVVLACALGAPLGLIAAGASHAQPGGPPPARPGVEEGVRWQDLKPAQREALKPLEREWSGIDKARKQKWIELSSRFAKMSPDQQQRLQARMSEWAKFSPQERGAARLHFEEAKQLAPQERKARWDAYQALPPEKRRELSERAAPPPEAARKSAGPGRNGDTKAAARDMPSPKSNIVPNPAFAEPPKAVAPTVLRAGPGATTTLISKRPTPPSHQQTGLPKIAATPEFVDKSTLLPQRGPQAAAAAPRSAAASAPGADAPKRR